MAQRRENFFKTVSASCWNLTGLMPVIPKKPVMVQHCKDSFEKSFGSVVARSPEFNGFNSRIIPLWRSIAKTFSREFLRSLFPMLEFDGFNSFSS